MIIDRFTGRRANELKRDENALADVLREAGANIKGRVVRCPFCDDKKPSAGIYKSDKELMGHSNISTTAEFYNQVDRDHEMKAARVIQNLLESDKGVPKANEICVDFAPNTVSNQIEGKEK